MRVKLRVKSSNKITAYIIAYNNISKIEAAINSVKWADEILLVDSNSTDGTTELAQKLGARVVQVDFNGFGDLRNKALEHCQHEWVFSLDSDERCTTQLRDEILNAVKNFLPNNSPQVYFVPRKSYFLGKLIKHSGWNPNYRQPQLFKKTAMRYTLEPVHEGYELLAPAYEFIGKHKDRRKDKHCGYLKNYVWQVPFENLSEVVDKANRYSSLGVEKLIKKNEKPSLFRAFYKGWWSFIKHYIFKKGFLDGWAGFIIAFGNFEGTFYRYAKLYEQQQVKTSKL